MRLITLALAALLILIQYPLWVGKGSWTRVWELDRQLAEHKAGTARLKARNEAIDAEVWPEILGTIGGENTVLIICRSPEARTAVSDRLRRLAGR